MRNGTQLMLGVRTFTALVGALALITGGMPAVSRAQGLGDCTNPSPQINKKALKNQPPAVQQAVAGFADLILAQGLNVPGVSVAVVIDQDVIFAAGFGCATLPPSGDPKHGPGSKGVPATASTIYRIESVTKIFEAVMTMQQRDKQHHGQPTFQLTEIGRAHV